MKTFAIIFMAIALMGALVIDKGLKEALDTRQQQIDKQRLQIAVLTKERDSLLSTHEKVKTQVERVEAMLQPTFNELGQLRAVVSEQKAMLKEQEGSIVQLRKSNVNEVATKRQESSVKQENPVKQESSVKMKPNTIYVETENGKEELESSISIEGSNSYYDLANKIPFIGRLPQGNPYLFQCEKDKIVYFFSNSACPRGYLTKLYRHKIDK
ncbi:hypothetical protein [Beggiatoa leptomitoformis]|uniref:Uncharacterized protein n=1 Tax=Beggiatoa leptomitoformis TaxID=288004 RepID=A0A2N9YGE3_9GAMM|nr:hypothetical protein [Beggiatoa leptomitoformis]ALG68235.2 hypothetical protein AL038_11590 [Beggiatoa leptomitoformis]AUI69459.2 hypothetical protein BLE401_12685 [Beggiatoa leptomitoformis]